jgi:hypothetical protein
MKDKKEKKKKQKIIYIDDGSTVADMNVEGMCGYDKDRDKRKKDPEQPTFREKLAMVFGAYLAYLPFLLILIGVLVAMWIFFSLVL